VKEIHPESVTLLNQSKNQKIILVRMLRSPTGRSQKQNFLNRHPEAVVCSPAKRQWGSQEDLTCAQWIWKRVLKLYEEAATFDGEIVRPKEPNWTVWANDVRLMRTLDGRSHKQICEMFKRVQSDTFWVRQVKCPAKLREKWDDLIIRLSAPGTGHHQAGGRDINQISRPDNTVPPGFRGKHAKRRFHSRSPSPRNSARRRTQFKNAAELMAWQREEGQKRAAEVDKLNQQARAEKIFGRSGIQNLHRSCSFANYTVNGDGQRHALSMAKSYAQNFGTGFASFVFTGKPGTGKTTSQRRSEIIC
jgi:hypothetical protein